jgi:hypothetical protein
VSSGLRGSVAYACYPHCCTARASTRVLLEFDDSSALMHQDAAKA